MKAAPALPLNPVYGGVKTTNSKTRQLENPLDGVLSNTYVGLGFVCFEARLYKNRRKVDQNNWMDRVK